MVLFFLQPLCVLSEVTNKESDAALGSFFDLTFDYPTAELDPDHFQTQPVPDEGSYLDFMFEAADLTAQRTTDSTSAAALTSNPCPLKPELLLRRRIRETLGQFQLLEKERKAAEAKLSKVFNRWISGNNRYL